MSFLESLGYIIGCIIIGCIIGYIIGCIIGCIIECIGCIIDKKKIKITNKLKAYIDINYKFPDFQSELYYKYNKYINELEDFRDEYCYYFDENKIYFDKSIEKLENYIKENNSLPSKTDPNILISHMAHWMEKQYNNESFMTYFSNEYPLLFTNNIEIIIDKPEFNNKLKKFIDENKTLPDDNNVYFLNNDNQIILFEKFKNDYSFYFEKDKYIIISFNKLEKYIKKNKKLPKKSDSDILISHMAHWMYSKLFKLKNNELYYNNEILQNKIDKINNYPLLFEANNNFIEKYQEYINELYNNNYIRNKELIDWFDINYKKYENEELTVEEYLMFENILNLNINPTASLYNL